MQRRYVLAVATILVSCILGMLLSQWWNAYVAAGTRIGVGISETDGGVEIVGVASGGPADRAGIRQGDLLVAVEGNRISDFATLSATDSMWRRGIPLRLGIERDGRPLEVTAVPGMSFPWSEVLIATVSCLAYLALGLLAFGQSPDDPRIRLLFFYAATVALEFALPDSLSIVPGWTLVNAVVFYLITGTEMGFELHLASVIPQPARWFSRARWLPGAYYAVGLGIGGLAAWAAVSAAAGLSLSPVSSRAMTIAINNGMLPFWSLAVPAILAHQTATSPTARGRRQALVVLLGCLPWLAYQLAYQLFLLIGGSIPAWMELAQPVALLLFPVAVFVAIFKFDLLDIEFVLRRSLVFMLVTASLVALAFMGFGLGTVLFSSRDDQSGVSAAALALGMLVLGLVFAPIRRWIQDLVDRRFFPESREMARMLTALAAELPGLGSLPAMGRHLVNDIVRVLDVQNATLLVAEPASGVQVTLASSSVDVNHRFGQTMLIEPSDPGIQRLVRAGRPLPADQLAGASTTLARRLHAFNADLVVGLSSGVSLVGVLLLGPKTGGERYRSSEIEMLSLFSHAAATVFENARLFESATYEGLTGLMRRETIIDKLSAELQRSLRYRRPLSVGMVDIDRFKTVNDRFGHLAGDAMLKHVARELQSELRTTDSIGRYGGEEFLFILPETVLNEARIVAEKLRVAVEGLDSPVDEAPGARVTVSIGVASIDHEGIESITTIDLIAEADRALLEAKRSGRNRVVASPVVAA